MNLIRARLTGHHKVYAVVVYTRRMVTKFHDTSNVVCNNYECTLSIVNLSGWMVIHKVATRTLTMAS